MFNKKKPAEIPVTDLVDHILLDAYENRATDVHFEPYDGQLRIRYRIDGVLHTLPPSDDITKNLESILSRIKVMAFLNISERRMPQDGCMKMRLGDVELNMRVSTMPTLYGEGIAVRLLSTNVFNMADLGMEERMLEKLKSSIRKPFGIIFVTGPTGSGKTTTLYTCLQELNDEGIKIITIEDPVEYQMKGITQVQVNPTVGLTFAQGLRSMLRHDPEIMMVGEVRDNETAEIAIKGALTGHLVLSTLHTNDALGAVTRLLNMNIEPYLISSSLECVIAQRLVRVICPSCKVAEKANDGMIAEFADDGITQDMQIFHGKGCEKCNQTGYFGRTGLYEMLVMDDDLRMMVQKREPALELRKFAISRGMRTLRSHGFEKVKRGITTISEVLRVTKDI
jgi:type II secretory ATPase GspE/PulE/Tfp pilus assembly ATPase PilB-like protein